MVRIVKKSGRRLRGRMIAYGGCRTTDTFFVRPTLSHIRIKRAARGYFTETRKSHPLRGKRIAVRGARKIRR